MNIGIFTDTFEPQINGVVTSIRSTVDYLSQHHNVTIFCPNVIPKLESTDQIWRFKSVVYPFLKEYRLAIPFLNKMKKITALNLDVIHIHTPFTMGYIGLNIAKKLNVPVIHTYHTFFEKYIHYFPIFPEKWMYKYAKKESQRFCNKCKLIIAPTDEMTNKLNEYNIKPPVQTLSNGINPYTPTHKEQQQMIDRFYLNNKKVCIFVGRLGKEKNIYFLLDAFEKIHQQCSDTHLLVIGDGPERDNLTQAIFQKDLSEHVTLTGYMNKQDVFTAFHIATLMLFPSISETQGLTVIEAFMSGTPVIGINKMGVKDVIGQSGGGILCNENLSEYVDASVELLTNEDKRKKCNENAKIRGNDFSSTHINKQLEQIYESVIKNHSKP